MKDVVRKERALYKFASYSSLMNIVISYGDEDFKFNLHNELVVDENRVNQELQEQPSAYAFLSMLHKKMIRKAKDKEREMNKVYSIMYLKYKNEVDENTNRPISNDVAKEKAISSKRYQEAVKEWIEADHQSGTLDSCVESFKQRAQLIQTLSANIRKEQ